MALLAPSVWAGILLFKAEKAYFPFFVVSFKSLSSDPGYLSFTSPAFHFVFFSEAEDWTNSTHIKSCNAQFPGDALVSASSFGGERGWETCPLLIN